jgi:hypothetical protein
MRTNSSGLLMPRKADRWRLLGKAHSQLLLLERLVKSQSERCRFLRGSRRPESGRITTPLAPRGALCGAGHICRPYTGIET